MVAHADSMKNVRVNYIFPHFPDQPIVNYIILDHGQIEKSYRIKDIYGIQTGSRIYKLQRKDLEAKPIPSCLYFGKFKFFVKYEGQEHICAYCAEIGHTEKKCPKNKILKHSELKIYEKFKTNNQTMKLEPSRQLRKSFNIQVII